MIEQNRTPQSMAVQQLSQVMKRLSSLPWLAEGTALLLGAVYLIQSIRYAHTSNTVLDEGAYLYKGLLFVSGRYLPYQDYGPWTNHMPLSFLIPGVAQTLFGAGIRTGRYFTIALGLLMLLGIWIATRRFGGSWWALFAVATLALNPALIQTYSIAVTQGLVACMVVWSMVLTLGENRPVWQTSLGAILAGLTLLTRENLAPLLPLLILYIFWQHGWRAGIWAALSGALTVGLVHAIYWPNILSVWAHWIPGAITPFLDPWRSQGGGAPVWQPNMPFESRWLSFLQALRLNFIPLVGVAGFGVLIFKGSQWKSKAHLRAATFLSVLFLVLFIAHAWAALWMSYCVFCFGGYLSFFTPIGLILIVLVNHGFEDVGIRWYGWFSAALILVVSSAVGYGAFQQIGPALLEFPLPRLKGGQFQGGSVPAWAILENLLHMKHNIAKRLISTLAGLLFGILFVLAVWAVIRRQRSTAGKDTPFGKLALNLFLVASIFFAQTPVLKVGSQEDFCPGDIISAYEATGAHLARFIPPGSKVYWEGGLSVVPMLYLPGVDLYPPQINDGYSYRIGGDSEDLYRHGLWNDELSASWLQEADFILLEERRYDAEWKSFLESGQFEELERSQALDICKENTGLRIFRREID